MAIELNKVVVAEDCKYIATTPMQEMDMNGQFSFLTSITTSISDTFIENSYIIPPYIQYGEFTIEFYRNNDFQSKLTPDEDWNWLINFMGVKKCFRNYDISNLLLTLSLHIHNKKLMVLRPQKM